MAGDASLALPGAVAKALASVAADHGYRRPRFHAELGSAPGDGFSGIVYRVRIRDQEASGTAEELSAICKTTATEAAGSLIALVYRSEDCMYKKALPAMQALAQLQEPLPWPRCLHSSAGEAAAPCLVLEDLRPLGFRMADRRAPLDEPHCRLALRQLARFHGAGMALKRLRPHDFQDLTAGLGAAFKDPAMQDTLKQMYDVIANSYDIVKDRFSKEVMDKLKVAFHDFAKLSFEHATSTRDAPANALIHGDCHVNNIMFQYDKGGAVTGCKLIDFQTARLGCTAVDVCTLLLPCTDRAMRAEHFDGLLRGYHAELHATLRAAGVADPDAVYSWDQFMATMRSEYKLSLCSTPPLLHALCGDVASQQELRDAIQDLDKMKDAGDAQAPAAAPPAFSIKATPELKRRFGDVVQDLVDWGWL